MKLETGYVKIDGKGLPELLDLSMDELEVFFKSIQLSKFDIEISERLLKEITSRIKFMQDVGLGYLSLNRKANTLSGGESQRINLATSLGSSLVGSMYILDEPSIGLHSKDNERLILVLKKLRDIGNTVIIVEHDEEIMYACDNIIRHGSRSRLSWWRSRC